MGHIAQTIDHDNHADPTKVVYANLHSLVQLLVGLQTGVTCWFGHPLALVLHETAFHVEALGVVFVESLASNIIIVQLVDPIHMSNDSNEFLTEQLIHPLFGILTFCRTTSDVSWQTPTEFSGTVLRFC